MHIIHPIFTPFKTDQNSILPKEREKKMVKKKHRLYSTNEPYLFVDLQATSMAEEPIQLTQLPMIWWIFDG